MREVVRQAKGAYRDVDQLQPVGMSNQVVGEHDSSLKSGIGPF